MQESLTRGMNPAQYAAYLLIGDMVAKSLAIVHSRVQKAQNSSISPQDMEIVQALRQHSSGPAADKNAVMATANALFGKTDQASVNKVIQAYQSFVSTSGPRAFASLGGSEGQGAEQGATPDAQAQEPSPHTLNNTAQPDNLNPTQATGSEAPGGALAAAAPAGSDAEGGEGGAPDPHYSAQRQSADIKQADNAGGAAVTPRLTKDSTISDEESNISADDTGNLTGGDVTHRKQGGQPTLMRGKEGGVYELTQNHNLRRISKKELAERKMGSAKHHSEEDPDNPSSPDPAARYGYAHYHEAEKHGLPALKPENVEGGIKAMHPADRPEGMENNSSEDPDDTFSSQHPGKQEVPDGHMSGKKSVTPQDIEDQLRHLSSFTSANGSQGHRLSWITDAKSEKASDGTKLSSGPMLHAIDFSIKHDPDGSIIIQPKINSYPVKGKGMSDEKKGEAIASGDAHPANMGEAIKKKTIYAPLRITPEMMKKGDLSQLNQMLAHLAAYAHLNRDKDTNRAMDEYASQRGSENEAHPQHQFKHFAGQSSSPMARSWQRKTEFAAMNKGYGVQYVGWNRFRKSYYPGSRIEPNETGQEEYDAANDPQIRQQIHEDPDEEGDVSLPAWHSTQDREAEPGENDTNQSWMRNRVQRALDPTIADDHIHVPLGHAVEGDIQEHPEVAAHIGEIQKQGGQFGRISVDPINNVAHIGPITTVKQTGAPRAPRHPTLGAVAKSWDRYNMEKSGFDAWHEFVARTSEGVTFPTMRLVEGSAADNVPKTWSEQKIGRARTKPLKIQTGAKTGDFKAKVKLAQGNDSINGGLPEQDKAIREVHDPYEKTPLDMVMDALLNGSHNDMGFGPTVESHDWQTATAIPISQIHGDSGTDYDKGKMQAMKQQIRSGKQLPPIIAIQHGPSSYHVLDGKHRVRAMRSLNKYEVNTIIGTPKKKKKVM